MHTHRDCRIVGSRFTMSANLIIVGTPARLQRRDDLKTSDLTMGKLEQEEVHLNSKLFDALDSKFLATAVAHKTPSFDPSDFDVFFSGLSSLAGAMLSGSKPPMLLGLPDRPLICIALTPRKVSGTASDKRSSQYGTAPDGGLAAAFERSLIHQKDCIPEGSPHHRMLLSQFGMVKLGLRH
jgi:hypothetical protein